MQREIDVFFVCFYASGLQLGNRDTHKRVLNFALKLKVDNNLVLLWL